MDFIGDTTHQTLPYSKLADFITNYNEYSNTKKRILLDSIELAKKMLKKEDLLILKALETKKAKEEP